MKPIRYILSAILIVILFAPACTTDGTDDVNPTDPRDKFLGDWKVNETCSRMNYNVQITADPDNSSQVLIWNFGNPGPGSEPAVGLVVSSTITVASQTIGDGWTVSGSGIYSSNGTISWTYSLVIAGDTYNCSAVYSK